MNKAVHWTKYPWDQNRWPNFSPQELACKGTGLLLLDEDAMDKLQALRNRLGRPLLLTSAYRSPEHNRNVKGARNSFHMRGMAFDVRMENQDPHEFMKAAKAVGFTGTGSYPRSGFIHVDNRSEIYEWGDPFPTSIQTGLAMEPPRQPETLAENHNAQAAGGVATVTGAVALADQVSKEGGILDRLQDPTTLLIIVAAVGVWLFWKEWKGR